MRNTGGPRSSRRRLLASVVQSTLLYGAQIWADVLEIKENRREILKIHRLTALRVISGFSTVSYEVAGVIANLMPANLLAGEARRLFETKQLRSIIKEDRKLAKSASMSAWQQQWDSSDKGRWTYRLITNIETWSTRKHGETAAVIRTWLL